MSYVTEIVKSPKSKKILQNYFDIEKLRNGSKKETEINQNLSSNAIQGIIIEQYILIHQFKNQHNALLGKVISDYRDLVKTLIKEVRAKKKQFTGNGNWQRSDNARCLFLYSTHEELLKSHEYILYNNQGILKQVCPYAFFENALNHSFIANSSTYFLEHKMFEKFVVEGCNLLLTEVYSKKKCDITSLVKLLYFQNIIYSMPMYLHNIIRFQNLDKLFEDYDNEIDLICNFLKQSEELIKSIGMIVNYQESCSFGEISGRIDFATKDTFIEIKSGKNIAKTDVYQALLYILISRTFENKHMEKIKLFNIAYLNLGLTLSFDIDEITRELKISPEVILNELINNTEKS